MELVAGHFQFRTVGHCGFGDVMWVSTFGPIADVLYLFDSLSFDDMITCVSNVGAAIAGALYFGVGTGARSLVSRHSWRTVLRIGCGYRRLFVTTTR